MIRAWKQFFFEPISPLPLAVFRLVFGTVMTLNLLLYGSDFFLYFGTNAVYPAEIVAMYQYGYLPIFDLMMYLPATDSWRLAFLGLSVLAGFLVTIGLATRFSTVVLFTCLLSLNTHFPMIVHAGDNFARLICLFLCFSPCGAVLSADYAIASLKGTSQPDQFFEPYAQRMIQLQLCFIYLINVVYKSMGASWQDGSAVYYATRLQEFFHLPVPEVIDLPILSQIATWSTLIVEFLLVFLLWPKKTRYPMIVIALLFHLGLNWCFNLGAFEWVFIATLILFVEPSKLAFIDSAFRAWLAKLSDKRSGDSASLGAPSAV